MRVLVTGSNGFVGCALCGHLEANAHVAVRAVRQGSGLVGEVAVGDIDGNTDWRSALSGCDAVVHLAARVHVMRDMAKDPLMLYRTTNTMGTLNLARQAALAGVRRLVFVSSIKVNGEGRDEPYRETDAPVPGDAYAVSKWEAEQALRQVSKDTGMEIVVARPPLVYGPGVKGNFLNLMRLIYKGIPLPVAGCHNRRSLLGLGNLVDFLSTCIAHPAAAGQTFVLSDGEDLATPDLVRRLAAAMNQPARLLSIPPGLLRFATRVIGKPGIYQRLCGSLRADSGHARRALGWIPPVTVDAELAATARAFLQQAETTI